MEDKGVGSATAIDISPEMLAKAMRTGFYSCCQAGSTRSTSVCRLILDQKQASNGFYGPFRAI